MRRLAATITLLAWLVPQAILAGCDDRDESATAPAAVEDRPVAAAASVAPLASLLRAVGGAGVSVESFAAGSARVFDVGDRNPARPAYRPDITAQKPLRDARLLAVGGRVDDWATRGLSGRLVDSAVGPVLTLGALEPARALGVEAARGAPWLDPVTMAAAARAAADRLGVIRPKSADTARAAADRLASRLEGLAAGRTPRYDRVAVLDDDPAMLLARLGIEPVRVGPPAPGRVLASPERVADAARAAGAKAVLLPADWARHSADAWARETGLEVILYDPLGPPDLADSPDPAEALATWLGGNVDALTRPTP